MKRWLNCLIPFAMLAILSASCSKTVQLEGEYYAQWADALFWGNNPITGVASFTVDINMGYTFDEETLNSGTKIFLQLTTPPTDGDDLVSAEYIVSNDPEKPYVVSGGTTSYGTYSFIEVCNNDAGRWQRFNIESGKVKIDYDGHIYKIKFRIVAGGSNYSFNYEGDVFFANVSR